MRSSTVPVRDGALAAVDLVELGARSALLWSSPELVLVGLDVATTIPVTRPDGGAVAQASLAALRGDDGFDDRAGVGPVGFAALPFDRTRPGELVVPGIVLAETAGERWLTQLDDRSPGEVESIVRERMTAESASPPEKIEIALTRPAAEWRDRVVGGARERIRSGELVKAVLARELVLTADADFDTPAVVRRIHRRFPAAYVFSVDGFVGASPELLVARSARSVRAHPLAGTAARGSTVDEDAENVARLRASTKDQQEHRITIEWLLAELLPFCSYVDAEPDPSVVSMANVHHLATLVEGVLSEPPASVLELVAAVHPTPAVGGDPQDRALDLIGELEGFDRGRYAGPVGWVDAAGNGEFAVGVRTAQVDGSVARVAAGVGVVADSDLDAELAETQAKFRAALGALLGGD